MRTETDAGVTQLLYLPYAPLDHQHNGKPAEYLCPDTGLGECGLAPCPRRRAARHGIDEECLA